MERGRKGGGGAEKKESEIERMRGKERQGIERLEVKGGR